MKLDGENEDLFSSISFSSIPVYLVNYITIPLCIHLKHCIHKSGY